MITTLAEDQEGRLWLGGREGGLAYYDLKREHLVEVDPATIVTDLIIDEQGYLWIAAGDGGLQRYDLDDGALSAPRAPSRSSDRGSAGPLSRLVRSTPR